jgi:hypothetical protein
MNKVEILKRSLVVKINLTADDWQLYDRQGVNAAAAKINRQLENVLLDATGDWYGRCYDVMQKASHYGATDTEPLVVLDQVLARLGLMEPAC